MKRRREVKWNSFKPFQAIMAIMERGTIWLTPGTQEMSIFQRHFVKKKNLKIVALVWDPGWKFVVKRWTPSKYFLVAPHCWKIYICSSFAKCFRLWPTSRGWQGLCESRWTTNKYLPWWPEEIPPLLEDSVWWPEDTQPTIFCKRGNPNESR